VQRLAVYLASNVYPPRNLEVGQQLMSFLPSEMAGKKAILTGPDGVPLDVPILKRGERGVIEFGPFGPVRTPGLYKVVPPAGPPIHYVFNADRKESDLARLSEAEVNDLARSYDIPVVRSSTEYKALESHQRYGTELWKWALLALLTFLFLELILQQVFARSRGKVPVSGAVSKMSAREAMEVKR
jgi:hypothetical protein